MASLLKLELYVHIAAHVMFLIFTVVNMTTGGWMVGALISSLLYAVYLFFAWLLRGVGSLIFFVIFLAMTFSWASFNNSLNEMDEWAKETRQVTDFSRHDVPGSIALKYLWKCDQVWNQSDESYSIDNNYQLPPNTTSYTIYNEKKREFQKWFSDNDWRTDGPPPIPTPQLVKEYVRNTYPRR